jgi:hypothetical protein
MQLHSVSIEGKTSNYVKFAGELPIHDHGSVPECNGSAGVKVGIEATAARERVRIRKQRTTSEERKQRRSPRAAAHKPPFLLFFYLCGCRVAYSLYGACNHGCSEIRNRI